MDIIILYLLIQVQLKVESAAQEIRVIPHQVLVFRTIVLLNLGIKTLQSGLVLTVVSILINFRQFLSLRSHFRIKLIRIYVRFAIKHAKG